MYSLVSVGARLYAGGVFSGNGRHIAEWNGTDWVGLGSGVQGEFGPSSGGVLALALSQAELFVGGGFNQAGGKPALNFAVWSIPQTLKVARSYSALNLSWPAPDTNLVLEATPSLASEPWQPLPQAPALQDNRWTVTNAISGTNQFFRLKAKSAVQ